MLIDVYPDSFFLMKSKVFHLINGKIKMNASSLVPIVGEVVLNSRHPHSYLSHWPHPRYLTTVPRWQQLLVILVLRLHPTNEAEDPWDSRLWQGLKDSQGAGMGTSLGWKMDVAVPSHKGASKEISSIEGQD